MNLYACNALSAWWCNSCSSGVVWNQLIATCWYHNIIKWLCTSIYFKHHGFLDAGFKQTKSTMEKTKQNKMGKNWNCLLMYIWRNCAKKCQEILEIKLTRLSQIKNQYQGPVPNSSFTDPQYSDKRWSNLALKGYIFTIGNTHKQSAWWCDSCSSGFL